MVRIPSKGLNDSLIKWTMNRVAEGQRLIEDTPGADLIGPCLDRMTSRKQANIGAGLERPSELATTTSNRFKKVLLEWVAAQTDIKPFWEIKTYNHNFDQQADIVSKLSAYWYTKSHADQRGLATALRWSSIAGTGYVHLHFDPRDKQLWLRADGFDPRDVLPIGAMPPWDTTQDWQGVVLRERTTVYHLEELWPDFDGLIRPDVTTDETPPTTTRAGKILADINAKARSPFHDILFSDKPKSTIGKQPTVDYFTLYMKDDSINESGASVEMGEFMDDPTWTKPEGVLGIFAKAPRIPANSWSYIVKSKEPLYPRGRQCMMTRSLVFYDGPSMYWHGQFPVLKLTPDPWVGESLLGLAPGWDLLSLQDALDWNLRVVDDHNAQVAQPGVAGDEIALGPNGLKAVNTRKAGLKILTTPMGKPIQILQPPNLDASITNHIEWIKQEMDDLSGVIDLKNLNQLNQIPSSETIDKMIGSMSYLLQGRSRVIESFMREFAEQMMYNFAQFFDTKARYTILGPSGVTSEDFDFDPGSFLPDYVHAEDYDGHGQLTNDAFMRGPRPRYDRAKEMIRQMSFYIAPGSLLSASDVTRKLMYLQLFRGGILDIWTLADVLGIPNMGVPPDGARTIPERLAAQQSMGIMVAPNPANPANPGKGHPPTAGAMPHLAQGGSTIAESK